MRWILLLSQIIRDEIKEFDHYAHNQAHAPTPARTNVFWLCEKDTTIHEQSVIGIIAGWPDLLYSPTVQCPSTTPSPCISISPSWSHQLRWVRRVNEEPPSTAKGFTYERVCVWSVRSWLIDKATCVGDNCPAYIPNLSLFQSYRSLCARKGYPNQHRHIPCTLVLEWKCGWKWMIGIRGCCLPSFVLRMTSSARIYCASRVR